MLQANNIIVQKYGGSSVATPDSIKNVAALIKAKLDTGKRLCIVVSAMGKTTDQLLQQASQISKSPSRRELDMLLSCGERASMALLSMALGEIGVASVSLTGSQSGIITDDVHSNARIVEVRPVRVLNELELGKVVIVAGFQGVSINKEITTLGRGGSDTTAVALAAALNAEACEIYSDVAGVCTADPRLVSDAQILEAIDYDQMIEMSRFGAKVMNEQAVRIAKEKGIVIQTFKTGELQAGTHIQPIVATRKKAVLTFSFKEKVVLVEAEDSYLLSPVLSTILENGCELLQCFSAGPFCCLVSSDDIERAFVLLQELPQVKCRLVASLNISCDEPKHLGFVYKQIQEDIKTLHHSILTSQSITLLGDSSHLAQLLKKFHQTVL